MGHNLWAVGRIYFKIYFFLFRSTPTANAEGPDRDREGAASERPRGRLQVGSPQIRLFYFFRQKKNKRRLRAARLLDRREELRRERAELRLGAERRQPHDDGPRRRARRRAARVRDDAPDVHDPP